MNAKRHIVDTKDWLVTLKATKPKLVFIAGVHQLIITIARTQLLPAETVMQSSKIGILLLSGGFLSLVHFFSVTFENITVNNTLPKTSLWAMFCRRQCGSNFNHLGPRCLNFGEMAQNNRI